jgi:Ca2+-binding EF-hand superfamily protein
MTNIKNIVMKDRLRLREFFQDHDILRKGYLPKMKFRNVLHAQKIQLTPQEYDRLDAAFAVPNDPTCVNYVNFNKEIENIFTEFDLEKNPTKTLSAFKAPSILDPKDVLSADEEQCLDATLKRLAREVQLRRLLIKPFFQDKDSQRSGFLSMSRFKQIFDNFKLTCSDNEYALINKRFQAKAANEINYCEFDHFLRAYAGDNKAF